MSSSGSRSLRTTRRRAGSTKVATTPAPSPQQRSSSYLGETRKAAAAAYHADALVMARMGFVPQSEDWSTKLEQVLIVGYVHAPQRAPAVLEALAAVEADPVVEPPSSLPGETTDLRHRVPMPFEARLAVGGAAGAIVGVALCLLVATVSGESPEAIFLGVFAVIGLLVGLMIGVVRE